MRLTTGNEPSMFTIAHSHADTIQHLLQPHKPLRTSPPLLATNEMWWGLNATRVTSFNCVTFRKLNIYPMHVIICIGAVVIVLSLFRARQLQWTGARETGTLWWFCCRMHGKSSLTCHLLHCMHPVRESMVKGCKTARLPVSVLNWHVADRCWYICSV